MSGYLRLLILFFVLAAEGTTVSSQGSTLSVYCSTTKTFQTRTSSTVSAPEKSSVSGIGHSSYTTLVQLTISRSSYLNTVHSSSSLQKSYQLTTSTTHLGLLSSQTEARPQSSETNTRISYSSKYTLLSSVTKTKFASSSEYTPLSLGTTHSSGPSSTSFQRTATSITQHSTSPPNPKSSSSLTSSIPPSTFTSITVTNATSLSSCYQLPTPMPSIVPVPVNNTQTDGSASPLIFFYSSDIQTLNYIGGSDDDGNSILFDVSKAGQIGIFVNLQPFILVTSNGLTIFGPNCSWAEVISIRNFYSQLSDVFAFKQTSTPAKRDSINVLVERQVPAFIVALHLSPDCGQEGFQVPAASNIVIFLDNDMINQCKPSTPVVSGGGSLVDIQFTCQQTGATTGQAACENGATSTLTAIQSNPWWQTITSSANTANTGVGWFNKLEIATSALGIKLLTIIQNAIPKAPLTVLGSVSTISQAVNEATMGEVATACGLFYSSSNQAYSVYLQFLNNKGAAQLVTTMQLTSVTGLSVYAYLWENLKTPDINARCMNVNSGGLSVGASCTTGLVCEPSTTCPEGQVCRPSTCCGGTSYCVNPATCDL